MFEKLCGCEFSEDEIAFGIDSVRAASRPTVVETATEASPRQSSRSVQLEVSQAGMLENLRWASVERVAPGAGEVQIEVLATGLNFRDVLCGLGMYPGKIGALGAECAGVITRVGDRVKNSSQAIK